MYHLQVVFIGILFLSTALWAEQRTYSGDFNVESAATQSCTHSDYRIDQSNLNAQPGTIRNQDSEKDCTDAFIRTMHIDADSPKDVIAASAKCDRSLLGSIYLSKGKGDFFTNHSCLVGFSEALTRIVAFQGKAGQRAVSTCNRYLGASSNLNDDTEAGKFTACIDGYMTPKKTKDGTPINYAVYCNRIYTRAAKQAACRSAFTQAENDKGGPPAPVDSNTLANP